MCWQVVTGLVLLWLVLHGLTALSTPCASPSFGVDTRLHRFVPVSVASCTGDGYSGVAVRDYTTTPLLPPCAVRRRRPSRHRLRATDDETSKSWSWLSRFVARSLLALVVVYGTPIVLFAHCQWPCAALLSAWARNFVSPVIVVDCCIAPLFSLFLRSSGRQLKHCAVQCVLLVLPLCLLFSHTDIYFCATGTNHVVVITLDFLLYLRVWTPHCRHYLLLLWNSVLSGLCVLRLLLPCRFASTFMLFYLFCAHYCVQ